MQVLMTADQFERAPVAVKLAKLAGALCGGKQSNLEPKGQSWAARMPRWPRLAVLGAVAA